MQLSIKKTRGETMSEEEKKTEEDARHEFNEEINADYAFECQWTCIVGAQKQIDEFEDDDYARNYALTEKEVEEKQEDFFYEWCSMYDDLKHIKRRNK
jgi:hypothetical protein